MSIESACFNLQGGWLARAASTLANFCRSPNIEIVCLSPNIELLVSLFSLYFNPVHQVSQECLPRGQVEGGGGGPGGGRRLRGEGQDLH